jgi:hypothetical protein
MRHRLVGNPSYNGGTHGRMRRNDDKRQRADTLFTLVAWELRKERNARCFRNNASTVIQVLVVFKHVTKQWADAGACKLGCLVREQSPAREAMP